MLIWEFTNLRDSILRELNYTHKKNKNKKSEVKKDNHKCGEEDVLDGKTLHDLYRHTTKLIK